MENMELYNKVRSVPAEAKKEITGGQLNGKTDINPMWRIKTLTEQFGVCGFGWKTEIVKEWLEPGAKGEMTAHVEINLYVKLGDAWSDAIPGIGGSRLIDTQKGVLHTDDDCYKKAYTDAISVACKALGIGADVYFEKDLTKYDTADYTPEPSREKKTQTQGNNTKIILHLISGTSFTLGKVDDWIAKRFGKSVPIDELSPNNFNDLYSALEKAVTKERGGV